MGKDKLSSIMRWLYGNSVCEYNGSEAMGRSVDTRRKVSGSLDGWEAVSVSVDESEVVGRSVDTRSKVSESLDGWEAVSVSMDGREAVPRIWMEGAGSVNEQGWKRGSVRNL